MVFLFWYVCVSWFVCTWVLYNADLVFDVYVTHHVSGIFYSVSSQVIPLFRSDAETMSTCNSVKWQSIVFDDQLDNDQSRKWSRPWLFSSFWRPPKPPSRVRQISGFSGPFLVGRRVTRSWLGSDFFQLPTERLSLFPRKPVSPCDVIVLVLMEHEYTCVCVHIFINIDR